MATLNDIFNNLVNDALNGTPTISAAAAIAIFLGSTVWGVTVFILTYVIVKVVILHESP